MSRSQGGIAVQSADDDQAKPKRNWWKTTVLSLLAIAVVGAAGYAAVRYHVVGDLISQPAIAATNDANPALAAPLNLRKPKRTFWSC